MVICKTVLDIIFCYTCTIVTDFDNCCFRMFMSVTPGGDDTKVHSKKGASNLPSKVAGFFSKYGTFMGMSA